VVFNRCAVSALEVCREKYVNSFISMYLYVVIYYNILYILYGLVCRGNVVGDEVCHMVKKVENYWSIPSRRVAVFIVLRFSVMGITIVLFYITTIYRKTSEIGSSSTFGPDTTD